MTVEIFHYITEKEVIEALVNQDSVKLGEIQALSTRLKVINDKMIVDIDAADEEEYNRLVGVFKQPDESLTVV